MSKCYSVIFLNGVVWFRDIFETPFLRSVCQTDIKTRMITSYTFIRLMLLFRPYNCNSVQCQYKRQVVGYAGVSGDQNMLSAVYGGPCLI